MARRGPRRGLLAGTANPVNGVPGAVILYALLAFCSGPPTAIRPPPSVAARTAGRRVALGSWLVVWLGLAVLALLPASRAPQAISETISDMASGEPAWLAWIDHHLASALAGHGLPASIVLAALFAAIALGILLPASAPASARRAVIVLAVAVAVVLWLAQGLGGMLTGSGTDPDSGPLLALLALAFWPLAAPAAPAVPAAPAASAAVPAASVASAAPAASAASAVPAPPVASAVPAPPVASAVPAPPVASAVPAASVASAGTAGCAAFPGSAVSPSGRPDMGRHRPGLTGIFAALMLTVAVYCAGRLIAARRWRRPTEVDTDVGHVLMGVAMAGMLAASLRIMPAVIWEPVFGAGALWFGSQALRARRGALTSPWRCLHPAPHMVECAAMLYMFPTC